ncbi:rho guanine nucleotide exchange factor 8-like isoform X1 [Salvia hispanica]|uniref:rho guanine nucleotide exchange factor 8-like isoform X1 n=1 Tax=Salvia hispanica TaxID=49212 RepID=UPI0020099BA1|nr:rho guanine nucleotide exchange factor 8-like isoform X1 [Salvia hispanica]
MKNESAAESSDMELMKERFSKLLLGEDMSGGGKGVSSALALSNAITNLAASVFGEQTRLEPMSATTKERWKKEIDCLVSVTDYIVEFVTTQQKSKDGSIIEVMVTQPRRDLLLSMPALRKLDVMLLDILDKFEGEQEFKYVSRDASESQRGFQRSDKWWLPTVKVPPGGLSEGSKRFLQKQRNAVDQVLKASMAINSQALTDMHIPDSYIETLPKNGKECIGESLYRIITDEHFDDPLQFISNLGLQSEHEILDFKDKIEACVVIWRRKMNYKDAKSAWGGPSVSLEKREIFEERAHTVLLIIKQKFPSIPQSTLEISKIQCNKDVGLAVLESYSRVLESLANTVMSRINDVLYANYLIEKAKSPPRDDYASSPGLITGTPERTILSDFISLDLDPSEEEKGADTEAYCGKDEEMKILRQLANIKKFSYTDTVEMAGFRSPARG